MTRYDESVETGAPQGSSNLFNALLFPANLVGLVHIGIYTVLLLILSLVRSAMIGIAGIAVGFIGLIVTIEMINYLHHCLRESASGATAAPDSLLLDSFDVGGVSVTFGGYFSLQAEYLTMIFPVIICFLPALLYPIFTQRLDIIFILLLGAGTFYFPMLLLAVVLFDSSSGYNPFIHIISIMKTFLSYCLLVIQLSLVVAGAIYLIYLFHQASWLVLALFPTHLYMVMVLMHLLGRFYYLHQAELNWDV